MKKKLSVVLIITVLGLSILFANGGAVYVTGFKSSGNITLMQAKNISLLKEDLNITPKLDVVEVNVIYQLDNRDKEQIIKYGFPFEHASWADLDERELLNNKWVSAYQISVNNEKLSYYKKCDEKNKYNNIIVWHLSDIKLKKGINIIEVKYSIKHYKAYQEFDSIDMQPTFSYNLTPASTWDNGVVKELNFTLDKTYINEMGLNISCSGLFTNSDLNQGKTVITKYNVDLMNIENIEIEFNMKEYEFNSTYSYKNNISDKMIKRITVSSTLLMKYSKANLTDGDFNTSWVEGKENEGTGEWIEVEFNNDGKNLPHAVGIANGYYQNEELYYANNRIKSLKVIKTQRDSERCSSMPEKYNTNKPGSLEYTVEEIVELPDLPYVKPDIGNAGKYLTLFECHDVPLEECNVMGIKKIRFEILSVYPGKKFNDTCISELLTFK